MTQDEDAEKSRSLEAVRIELLNLSDIELLKLKMSSSARCQGSRLNQEDLLQEAFVNVLDGTRPWPKKVLLINFFDQVMRSIASNDRKKASRYDNAGDNIEHLQSVSIQVEEPTVEDKLGSDQTAALLLGEILSLLDDDELAQVIFEGRWVDDMDRTEIQELTGLADKEYESKLKKIKRRINKYVVERKTP